jgi:methyl-accepting chemotaxis protein
MTWFKNLGTMAKLMLGFGFLAALMALVGYEGVTGMSQLRDMTNALFENDVSGILAIKEVDGNTGKIGREMRQAMIDSEIAAKQKNEQRIDGYFGAIEDAMSRAGKSFVTEEGKAALARIRATLPEYRTAVKDVLRHTMANDSKAAIAALEVARVAGDKVIQPTLDASNRKEHHAKQSHEEGDALFTRLRATMFAIMCGGLGMAIGLGYFVARLVSKPLGTAVEVLEAVSGGDLTRSLDVATKDEIGRMAGALNSAVEGMRNALTEVRGSADSLATSSQELAASSEELSSGAQQQASSLEETSASLEEITSSVKQNADSARQANQLAAAARETAEKGGQVVTSAVSAMGEINTASKRIADIITTIDEIAFQTNLLALNAAVEAARAGEQGRGFAVVAGEVRTLAQRSATAAKEIKALIQDSVRKVEAGSQMVNQSGEVLVEIVASVKRVTDIVGEIAAASREQSAGIEQVAKAMSQMDQITQQNASQTEELSATAQSLSSSADQLQGLVGQFRLENERAARRVAGKTQTPAKAAKKPAAQKATSHGLQSLLTHVGPAASAELATPSAERTGGFAEF